MTRANSQDAELERMREEIRHLRGLLAGRDQVQAIVVTPVEQREVAEAWDLIDARAKLEQQSRLFDTVLSSIVDFTYVLDREGCFTYVNKALLDLWQFSLENAIGKNFFELPYPHELAARLHEQIQQVFTTGKTLRDETSYTGPSGNTGYYEYIFVPVLGRNGQVESVVGSTREISERHQELAETEALLRGLEVERERLASLFMQAPAFITVTRGPNHITEIANAQYHQLVGPDRDIIGRPVRESFPEVEGQGFFEILDEVYRTGKPFLGNDMRILFQVKPGVPVSEHYLDFVYQPLREADGSVSGIFVHGVDLTERKRAKDALQQSEARFRAAVLAVSDIIWTNSPTGQMEGEQADWTAFTGQTYDQYRGYGWANAVHPEDAQPTIDAWDAAVAARRLFVFEHRIRRYDGVWRHFSIRVAPVLDIEGNIQEWIGVHRDITEQRESEAKISALNAQLRRAIVETHHRVKNNLQLISAIIDIQTQSEQEMVPMSDLIRVKQNIQALGVIHDILTKEAKAEGEADVISAKEVLEEFLPLLQATLGNRHLVIQLEDLSLPGRQATSLALVANELVSNALKHGQGDVEVTLCVETGRARLEVCDDGPGFSAGFDPETAAHTGLELIENIARHDLRGKISYENREAGGARVTIVFPVS